MKKIYILILLVAFFNKSFSQIINYNMSNTSTVVPCGSTFNFFDSGGSGSNYTNNENYALTLSAGAGSCLTISFTTFSVQPNCNDNLTIIDGAIGGATLGVFCGNTLPGPFTSSTGSLTFVFDSNNNNNFPGWQALVQCTSCPAPGNNIAPGNVTITCPSTGNFYDTGGNGGNYSNSENITRTYYAPAGSCLTFSFSSFSTESCCDRLRIYDGPNGGAPLIGTYNGLSSPGVIVSSGTSLTFSWTSDGSITDNGWAATYSCVSACAGAPSGGTANASPSSSCSAFTTTLTVSGSPAACGLTYQWQSAALLAGPYSNIVGATGATHTSNINSTTYFRRLTTCGVLTGTSAVVTASLSAPTISCSLSTYSASTVTYSFETFVGTAMPTTDDVLFSSVTMFGFPFCFAGQQFSGGYVASNSSFVFDAFPCNPNIQTSTYAAAGVSTGYVIGAAAPVNNTSIPRNAILGPWHDIYPTIGGLIQYTIVGTAPNRRFVLSYENIPMFSCTTMSFTGQIKLFETSGNIEVHIANKPVCTGFNGGQAVMGLHNHNGTIYVPPVNMVNHNAPTQWTMSNTAYRWTTSCPVVSNCAVPLPVEFKSLYGQQISGINKIWWETADEKNIKEFELERSDDAINFKKVYTSMAVGKGSKYAYDDDEYKRGYINYYKVTAIDIDGKRTSTSIYPIFNTDDPILIKSVFPNPASDKLSIEIYGRSLNTDCSFVVYDQFGKTVVKKDQKIAFGSNNSDLNIEELQPGIYIIEIKTSDNSIISKQKFTKL